MDPSVGPNFHRLSYPAARGPPQYSTPIVPSASQPQFSYPPPPGVRHHQSRNPPPPVPVRSGVAPYYRDTEETQLSPEPQPDTSARFPPPVNHHHQHHPRQRSAPVEFRSTPAVLRGGPSLPQPPPQPAHPQTSHRIHTFPSYHSVTAGVDVSNQSHRNRCYSGGSNTSSGTNLSLNQPPQHSQPHYTAVGGRVFQRTVPLPPPAGTAHPPQCHTVSSTSRRAHHGSSLSTCSADLERQPSRWLNRSRPVYQSSRHHTLPGLREGLISSHATTTATSPADHLVSSNSSQQPNPAPPAPVRKRASSLFARTVGAAVDSITESVDSMRHKKSSEGAATTGNSTSGSSGKVACVVTLLDGRQEIFHVPKSAKGAVLFERVCKSLDLVESSYFGLRYQQQTSNNVWYWLSLKKRIRKSIPTTPPWHLELQFKFYPPQPSRLKEALTRYLLCLQIRQNILCKTLPCSYQTFILLGTYVVQSEMGDYSALHHGNNSDYLQEMRFAPDHLQTRDMLEKIVELHKCFRGMSPEEADLRFLENAKKLSLYGVDFHKTKDSDLMLGVYHAGILIYSGRLRISRFFWSKIMKISYQRSSFRLNLRKAEYGRAEKLIEFRCQNSKMAKRLWKTCVEHHAFFRLRSEEDAVPKRPTLLSVGGTMRFNRSPQLGRGRGVPQSQTLPLPFSTYSRSRSVGPPQVLHKPPYRRGMTGREGSDNVATSQPSGGGATSSRAAESQPHRDYWYGGGISADPGVRHPPPPSTHSAACQTSMRGDLSGSVGLYPSRQPRLNLVDEGSTAGGVTPKVIHRAAHKPPRSVTPPTGDDTTSHQFIGGEDFFDMIDNVSTIPATGEDIHSTSEAVPNMAQSANWPHPPAPLPFRHSSLPPATFQPSPRPPTMNGNHFIPIRQDVLPNSHTMPMYKPSPALRQSQPEISLRNQGVLPGLPQDTSTSTVDNNRPLPPTGRYSFSNLLPSTAVGPVAPSAVGPFVHHRHYRSVPPQSVTMSASGTRPVSSSTATGVSRTNLLPAPKWRMSLLDISPGLTLEPLRGLAVGPSTAVSQPPEGGGARCAWGISSYGKYFYEVIITGQQAKSAVRVGWSTQNASLLLGEDRGGFGFGAPSLRLLVDSTSGGSGGGGSTDDSGISLNMSTSTSLLRSRWKNTVCSVKITSGEGIPLGDPLMSGDVVGCFLDLHRGSVFWSCNGKLLDEGLGLQIPGLHRREPFFPAVAINNCSLLMNFGDSPFVYPPPEDGGWCPVNQAPRHLLACNVWQGWHLNSNDVTTSDAGVVGIELSADALVAQTRGSSSIWHGIRANRGLLRSDVDVEKMASAADVNGLFYYEVTILELGQAVIGSFNGESGVIVGWGTGEASLRLGEDELGVGFGTILSPDGRRTPSVGIVAGAKWSHVEYGDHSEYGAGVFLKCGDTIGCLLDLDASTVLWTVNGMSLKKSGKETQEVMAPTLLPLGHHEDAFFPILTARNATAACNFGSTPFKFDPPHNKDGRCVRAVCAASKVNIQVSKKQASKKTTTTVWSKENEELLKRILSSRIISEESTPTTTPTAENRKSCVFPDKVAADISATITGNFSNGVRGGTSPQDQRTAWKLHSAASLPSVTTPLTVHCPPPPISGVGVQLGELRPEPCAVYTGHYHMVGADTCAPVPPAPPAPQVESTIFYTPEGHQVTRTVKRTFYQQTVPVPPAAPCVPATGRDRNPSEWSRSVTLSSRGAEGPAHYLAAGDSNLPHITRFDSGFLHPSQPHGTQNANPACPSGIPTMLTKTAYYCYHPPTGSGSGGHSENTLSSLSVGHGRRVLEVDGAPKPSTPLQLHSKPAPPVDDRGAYQWQQQQTWSYPGHQSYLHRLPGPLHAPPHQTSYPPNVYFHTPPQ